MSTAQGERGSALVEFAIASTVTLTMIFGIIDFGRGLYTYHLVANAARAGSRYAIVRGSACAVAGCPATSSSIQTYVRGLAPGIDPNSLAVTTTWPGGNAPGQPVTVSVTYPFRLIVSILPSFTMPMTSASTMVISQ